jgi:hypothetical protein
MKGMVRLVVMGFCAFAVIFIFRNVWALTPEQVISLKNAGVSDQTIQLMIRQEQEAVAGTPDSPGRKEVIDKDGKSVIIYSTGHGTGNSQGQEGKQTEKAWEMLNSLIVDTRKSK